jgi:hypothetical protein
MATIWELILLTSLIVILFVKKNVDIVSKH